jgi:opacity protein-like surface antigen
VTRYFLAFLVVVCAAADAAAQARQPARPPVRPQPAPVRATTSVRGFADIGVTSFTAKDSFEATLGSATGTMFGGGAEVVLPQNIFFGVRVSRFTAEGERVFVSGGQTFPLGIPMSVTITPVLLTGGLRFGTPRSKVLPYVGGGIGWHRYQETSDFAGSDDDVNGSFQGYHVLGGAEYRVSRLLGVAGEAQWAAVPNALGQNPLSASAEFGDTDLGGFTIRVKIVIGR